MFKKTAILSLMLLFTAGCSLQTTDNEDQSELAEETVDPIDLRVAGIGDSLTEGIGDESDKGGYQENLLSLLEKNEDVANIEFSHLGKKGLSSSGLVERMKNGSIEPIVKDADAIIITIGGNDIMNTAKKNYKNLKKEQFDDQLEEFSENVTYIINELSEISGDADIYLVGLYNPFEPLVSSIQEFEDIMNNWNNRIKSIDRDNEHVHYVEISPYFKNKTDSLIYEEDFFHPNAAGYSIMGEEIYKAIETYTIPRLLEG